MKKIPQDVIGDIAILKFPKGTFLITRPRAIERSTFCGGRPAMAEVDSSGLNQSDPVEAAQVPIPAASTISQ